MLHDDLAEVQSLVAGARSTQEVFPAMALQDLSVDERLVLLEEEYVVLVRRLRPERFGGNSPVSYTHLDVYKRQDHTWL